MHRTHGGIQGQLLLVHLLGFPRSGLHGGEFHLDSASLCRSIPNLFFPVPLCVLLCEVCPHLDGRLQVSSLGGGSWFYDLSIFYALGAR